MNMCSYQNSDTLKYQFAIALNNAAVSLLQQQRYRDALSALRASISEIQTLAPTLSGHLYQEMSAELDGTVSLPSSWCALSQASKRLACPQTREEIESRMLSPADLYLISSENFLDSPFLITSNLFSDSTEFAMRIDDDNRRGINVDAATVLFNYCTACRCCLDFTECTPEEEDYLFNISLRLQKLARRVLCEELEMLAVTPSFTAVTTENIGYLQGLDWKMSARIMVQLMLVARSLWSSTSSLNVEDECEIYYQETVQWSHSFVNLMGQMRLLEFPENSGASAA